MMANIPGLTLILRRKLCGKHNHSFYERRIP
jgi:hypothetical protein